MSPAFLLALSILGFSTPPGHFQPASILAEGRQRMALAGRAQIEEGDTDQFAFPTADARYQLGLGIGDFGVQLLPIGLRGSLKLPLMDSDGTTAMGVEFGLGASQSSFSVEGFDFERTEFSADAVLLVDLEAVVLAPSLSYNLDIMTGDDRRHLFAGLSAGRRLPMERSELWVEFGVHWKRTLVSSDEAVGGNRSTFLFTPGVGAAIEF